MKLAGFKNNLIDGKGLCAELYDFLNKEKPQYEQKLIPDLSYINHIAECSTGIDITAIEHRSNNIYRLNYSLEWSIYNGCSDLDEKGTISTHVSFKRESDSSLVFDMSVLEASTSAGEL